MLDQCHNIEPKIPGQIRSVMNVQEATAKALLIDAEALAAAQRAGDVLGANGVLMDAYNTDVRPLLAGPARGARPAPGPDGGVRASGYASRSGRAGRRPQAGWGEPRSATPREHRRRPRRPRTRTSEPVTRTIAALSNRLGADPRNTNYAGGNTSAKGTATDPVTGRGRSSCSGSRAPAVTSAR